MPILSDTFKIIYSQDNANTVRYVLNYIYTQDNANTVRYFLNYIYIPKIMPILSDTF